MTEEETQERRRLFLEEMARLREHDRPAAQQQEAVPSQSARPPRTPETRRAGSPRPNVSHLALLILCLALTFPVFSYAKRQADDQAALQGQRRAVQRLLSDRMDAAARRERVLRARAFFGLPGIAAVRRRNDDLFLILRPATSHAELVSQAQGVRAVLSTRVPRPPGFPFRQINLCRGDAPCPVSVAHMPSGPGAELWRVIENGVAVNSHP